MGTQIFYAVGIIILMLLLFVIAWKITAEHNEKQRRIAEAKLRNKTQKKTPEVVKQVSLHYPEKEKVIDLSKEQDDVVNKIFQDSNIFKQ